MLGLFAQSALLSEFTVTAFNVSILYVHRLQGVFNECRLEKLLVTDKVEV